MVVSLGSDMAAIVERPPCSYLERTLKTPAASVLRLCGGIQLEAGGDRLDDLLPAGQASLLLAFLIVNRNRAVSRDDLVNVIWPDRPPSDPEAVLSTLLSRTRRAVLPIAIEGRAQLRLLLPEPAWIDIEVARAVVEEALAAQEDGDWPTVYERARAALDLLSDEFLPGFAGDWVEDRRRELHALALRAHECVARSAAAGRGGTLDEGILAARTLIDGSPFREAGYRLLMELLEAEGNVAEALQVYEELRRLVGEELGTAPAGSTRAVHQRLLEGGARPTRGHGGVESGSAKGALPTIGTSFVGREAELAELERLLHEHRAVTVIGPGGIGKTRLAVRAAQLHTPTPPDGPWFVDLAPVPSAGLVAQSAASALGVREQPGRPATESVVDALRSQETFGILDNCEHVIAAAAELAHELTRSCPRLWLVITSREPLGYQGEQVLQLGPLPTPANSVTASTAVAAFPGVELFRQRAGALVADFMLTDANAGPTGRLCRRLDGMPLAIELAAALVAEMGIAEIDERLDERLRFSMTAAVRTPGRHHTLRTLVDWSHDLLGDAERAVFRRFAVFQGGATLRAVETVCSEPDAPDQDVLDVLRALVRKSLVVKEEHGTGARYRMLETIRQYANEKLDESDDGGDLRDRHVAYYLRLAEEAEPELADDARQVAALDELEAELDNFRGALATALADGGASPALAISSSLFQLWYLRGHMSEGRRWLDAAAATSTSAASESHTKALAASGELAREQGDYDIARVRLAESLAMARELGTLYGYGGSAFSLFNLGAIAWEQGDYERADALLQESLEILQGVEEDAAFGERWPLLKLGQVALDRGDQSTARSYLERSLAGHRRRGDREGIARALDSLGRAALANGDVTAARLLSERSLAAAQELGYSEGLPGPLQNLARVALAEDDPKRATELSTAALEVCDEIGSKRGVVTCIEGLACAVGTRGDSEAALTLFGAAAAMWAELGSPRSGHLCVEAESAMSDARSALADGLAAAAWSAGLSMTRDQAGDFARAI
jgi:predicted ATPase/DNA-binding SARP family transcriptional activator/Tfp pilus assembly protein PilF